MKIAILSSGRHDGIGGTETYNHNLIKFLMSENHEITEFPEKINAKLSKKVWDINFDYIFLNKNYFSFIKNKRKSKSNVEEIARLFDLVIISGGPYVWNYDLKNVIFIQHFNHEYFINKFDSKALKIKKRIDSLLSFTKYKTDPISKAKNVLYFSKNTLSPRRRKDQNIFFNIPFYLTHSKLKAKNNKSVFIGRIESEQKNIKNLMKNTRLNIDIYGSGNNKKWLEKKYPNTYKGFLKTKEVHSKFAEYKMSILPSKYEGCALSVMESASAGTLTVLFDTFDYVKDLEKIGICKVIKPFKWKEFEKTINNHKYCPKSVQKRALNHFSKIKYENRWKKIISFFKA